MAADDLDLEALLEAPYKPSPSKERRSRSPPHRDSAPRSDASSRHREEDRHASRRYNDRDRERSRRDDRRYDDRRHDPRDRRSDDRRYDDRRDRDRRHSSRDRSRDRRSERPSSKRPRSPSRDRRRPEEESRSKAPSNRRHESELTPEERDRRTVFVSQLSHRLTEQELFAFFEKAGRVRDARLIGDKMSRKSKGVAYVEFFDVGSVHNALALTGKKLLGIPMIVEVSEAEKNRIAAANALQPHEHGTRLYIGALHFSLTEKDIKQIFEPFGPIETIVLLKDEIGRSKGTDHIQFVNAPDARKAMERMNGFDIAGRTIRVGMLAHNISMTGSTQLEAEEETPSNYGMSTQARADLMSKLARDPSFGQMTATPNKTTLNCLLTNMFDPDEETAPNWDEEIRADVEMECNKYGRIRHCFVDKPTRGHVYLKFDAEDGCQRAVQALNGRWFAGKQISATFISDDKFKQATGY